MKIFTTSSARLVAFLAILGSYVVAFGTSPFTNIHQIQSQLNFNKYYTSETSRRALRVAILDKGFDGYQKELGLTLPANTRYVAGPVTAPPEVKTEHGLKMAQIFIALMTNEMNAPQWQPELILYNVYGFSNFQTAVTDMITQKVDLVLYSEVWEYGGNNDGQGFINNEVNRATNAGVIWVNAAGNFALTTYNTAIHTNTDNWLQLPDQNSSISIQCKANKGNKCPVKIVISWNDFKNNVDEGTDKDLDIALTDDLLNIIETGGLKQSKDPKENRPGYSKYPREIVSAEINPGIYFIRVKNRSSNFSANDRLRISVDGENILMPSHSTNETILNPGDNISAVTVGASDSDRSSSSVILNKPDIMAPSSLILTTGDEFRGSSNSAAIVAAGFALLKTRKLQLTKVDLLRYTRNNNTWNWNQTGLSLNQLFFGPTGPGCFLAGQVNSPPPYLNDVLNRGGVLVQTSLAIRVIVPYDPLLLAPHLRRVLINDMIVSTPRGYEIYSRTAYIPPGSIEIFQRPLEAGLCNLPKVQLNKSFSLP